MQNKLKIERFNLISMMVEGGLYFTGYTYWDVYVVIPVFIEAMTGDIKLASLAVAIKLSLFIFPQLVMGFYTSKIKHVPRFLGITGFIGRASTFLVPISLILNISINLKVAILLLVLIFLSFADGVTHVPWLDILSRTISPSKRGRLLGYQLLFGGIGGFISGLIIKYFLSRTGPLETNYSHIFLIGAVFLTLSGALLFALKDIPKEDHHESINIFKYLKQLPQYLVKNKDYKSLIITRIFEAFNALAAPLYVIFSKNHFDLNNDQVTSLMFVQIIGSIAAGLIWGQISHRKGNKILIQSSLIVSVLTSSLAVFLSFTDISTPMPILTIMVFMAGMILGNWLGFINYLLDILPDKERPAYLALTSSIMFPFALVPFLGGIIVDSFGFSTVFIIVTVFIIFALYFSRSLRSVTSS